MEFEYDSKKSLLNKQKHGVSLEEAKILWLGTSIRIPARTTDEARFMMIGKIKEKLYSCIFTLRGESIIRLISARRSRKQEEKIYYEFIQ